MTLASVSQLAPLIGFKVEGLLLHPQDPLRQVQGPPLSSRHYVSESLGNWQADFQARVGLSNTGTSSEVAITARSSCAVEGWP